MSDVIVLRDVERSYGIPPVHALSGVSLRITGGELVAIVGPSGSGKSTLLNIIGTLDHPTNGQAIINGADVRRLSDSALSAVRARGIGFVFQQFHLSDGVTALDNVADGLIYSGIPHAERRQRAFTALTQVGLEQRARHKSHELSGGERQRVAIARAIVGNPPLLLADEPTGNLDSVSGGGIVDLLRQLNSTGMTVVVITHDATVAQSFPRQVEIRDGRIVSDRERAA